MLGWPHFRYFSAGHECSLRLSTTPPRRKTTLCAMLTSEHRSLGTRTSPISTAQNTTQSPSSTTPVAPALPTKPSTTTRLESKEHVEAAAAESCDSERLRTQGGKESCARAGLLPTSAPPPSPRRPCPPSPSPRRPCPPSPPPPLLPWSRPSRAASSTGARPSPPWTSAGRPPQPWGLSPRTSCAVLSARRLRRTAAGFRRWQRQRFLRQQCAARPVQGPPPGTWRLFAPSLRQWTA
mmetsp:Transcript_8325/g.22256  ORF Transcript_8325/g.22256 Transcript_8325/m.22256 type:complete len:237 (-) Transcript_8325:1146-1856(-)